MDRTQRKKIKQDEFVTETLKVFQYLEDHPKPFLAGAVVIVVAVGAVWGFLQLSHSRTNRSADLLARGQAALGAPVVIDETPKPGDMYRPTFASDQQRAKVAAERLKDAAGASGNPGRVAEYLEGVALIDAGNGAEAVTTLEKAVNTLGSDPTLGPAAKSALAQAYEAAGRWDKATDSWRALSADGAGYPKDLALVGLARALERAGKMDEAKTAFKQVVEQFPESPAANNAKASLARLGS